MAGLRFTTGLDVAAGPQARYGSAANPSSATAAAFGESVAASSPAAGLHPGSPGGLALWAGIGGVVFLVLIYRSLPG